MLNKQRYQSDIVLGERYIDEQTGFEGIATAVSFYQYACERVVVEAYDAERREVKEQVFDAPRLTSAATKLRATTERTGGPRDVVRQAGSISR